MRETVLVLDFGGQYNQLIARRVRDLSVYAEILPCDAPLERILSYKPIGIIFTGGPASVTDEDAPQCDPRLFDAGIPILGICYGAQLMGQTLGGTVKRATKPRVRQDGNPVRCVLRTVRRYRGRLGVLDEPYMVRGHASAGLCGVRHHAKLPGRGVLR